VRTHCKRGHALTPENLTLRQGHRCCRLCINARSVERYRRLHPKDPLRATHCKHGHELTLDNVYSISVKGRVFRGCRTCRKLLLKKRYKARKAKSLDEK
jgi:hypothetical protein